MAEPKHMDGDGRDLLAAQYVLGVLDLAERREAERLSASDPAFGALVGEWEERLVPLADAYEPSDPPPAVRTAIEARLFGAPEKPAGLWQSLSFWRPLALAASLALVVSLGYNIYGQAPTGEGGNLIVSLQPAGDTPVNFVALYQPDSGAVRLSPVSGEAETGKDFELWLIEGDDPPLSLGVLPKSGTAEIVIPPGPAGKFRTGATLAISLEPQGGSPTGQPTGPVVAAGKAQPI